MRNIKTFAKRAIEATKHFFGIRPEPQQEEKQFFPDDASVPVPVPIVRRKVTLRLRNNTKRGQRRRRLRNIAYQSKLINGTR